MVSNWTECMMSASIKVKCVIMKIYDEWSKVLYHTRMMNEAKSFIIQEWWVRQSFIIQEWWLRQSPLSYKNDEWSKVLYHTRMMSEVKSLYKNDEWSEVLYHTRMIEAKSFIIQEWWVKSFIIQEWWARQSFIIQEWWVKWSNLSYKNDERGQFLYRTRMMSEVKSFIIQ